MLKGITLKWYQEQVLEELFYFPAIALFMGTGTGKTITSLWRFKQNGTPNLLVLSPAKIVKQWEQTISNLVEGTEVVEFKKSWSSKKRMEHLKQQEFNGKVVVISLESSYLFEGLEDLIDDSWTVIVDESHRIKESGTKRKPVKTTEKALKIGEKTPWKIILTATPTQKAFGGYMDYYTQLTFLGYLDMDIDDFKHRFVKEKAIQVKGRPYPIKTIVGYRPEVTEIEDILKMVSRRYKPKYGDEEPVHTKVMFEKSKGYKELVKERYYEDLELKNPTAFLLAKRTMSTGTVMGRDRFKEPIKYQENTNKIDWLKDFILDNQDEKMLIFYNYNVERDALVEMAKSIDKKFIVLDGDNKNKIEEIEKGDYDLVIGQFKASGESVDGLQYQTHIAIYFQLPISALDFEQSKGRIDRVGQEGTPMYYYLLTEGTVDTRLYAALEQNIEMSEELLAQLELEEE